MNFNPNDSIRLRNPKKVLSLEFQPSQAKIEDFDLFMDFGSHFIRKIPLINYLNEVYTLNNNILKPPDIKISFHQNPSLLTVKMSQKSFLALFSQSEGVLVSFRSFVPENRKSQQAGFFQIYCAQVYSYFIILQCKDHKISHKRVVS